VDKKKIIYKSFVQEIVKTAQAYNNQTFPNQKELDIEQMSNTILNPANDPNVVNKKSKADTALDN
jgi:hypothetical protein